MKRFTSLLMLVGLSATSPAPSAGRSPSAPLCNGRDWPVGLSACSAVKPMWMKRSSAALTAPASIRSARPSWSRSQAREMA